MFENPLKKPQIFTDSKGAYFSVLVQLNLRLKHFAFETVTLIHPAS